MTDYIRWFLDHLEGMFEVRYKADLVVWKGDEVIGRWHLWCDRNAYGDKFVATAFVEADEYCADEALEQAAEKYIQDRIEYCGSAWHSGSEADDIVVVGVKDRKTIGGDEFTFDLDVIAKVTEKEEATCEAGERSRQ